MRKYLLPSVVVIVVVVGGFAVLWWPNSATPASEPVQAIDLPDSDPDLLAMQVVVRKFDMDGRLQYTVEASQVEHHDREDARWGRMMQPRVAVFDRQGREWNARSQTGVIRYGVPHEDMSDDYLELAGEVLLTHVESSGHVFEVTSPKLAVYVRDELITSPSGIQINIDGGSISAGAMRLKLNEKWVRLTSNSESRVSMVFDPRARRSN